jgi:hypothetical protein
MGAEMIFLNGMKVIESPYIQEVQRIQLSHAFNDCSIEFKQHMNNWLREKFGTYMPTYIIGGNTIAMHPKHIAILKQSTMEPK